MLTAGQVFTTDAADLSRTSGAGSVAPEKPLVLDTNVMLDAFVIGRPRHHLARQLVRFLLDRKADLRIPWTTMLEIHSSLAQIRVEGGPIEIALIASEEEPVNVRAVAVDQAFVSRHLTLGLPYLKAGDAVQLSLAKADSCILITEDARLYARAKEASVEVYGIGEFLEAQGLGSG
jgi:predicted nucleic acid-binding protein